MLTRLLAVAVIAISATFLIHADFADAARLGGGRSFGMQRPSVAPSMPAPSRSPSAIAPAPPSPAAAAPAAGGASRWLGPIAGIAAGLGLAALLSHFGLSEAAGSFLLIALLLIGAIFVVRLLFARRSAPATGGAYVPPLNIGRTEPVLRAASSPSDALAPAWGGAAAAQPAARPRWPAGFEPAPFIENAKRQFNALQTANDRADRALLADVTTPEMFADIIHDFDVRGPHTPTEIVTLDAEILEVTTEGDRHLASVRFTGTSREDGAAVPQRFDEVWNLVKPVNGSTGWLLAGIQQTANAVS